MKKLGAGTAIAVGASTVLSSRDVAYAASCFVDTGSLPSGSLGGLLTVSSVGGRMQFVIGNNATCTCGGSASATYSWGSLGNLNVPSGAVASVSLSSSGNTATVTGFNKGGNQHPFKGGETYTLNVQITWECAPDSVTRTFQINATAPSSATSSQL